MPLHICTFCIIYLEWPDPPSFLVKLCPMFKTQLQHGLLWEAYLQRQSWLPELLWCLHLKWAPNVQGKFPRNVELGHYLCWGPSLRNCIKAGQWWSYSLKVTSSEREESQLIEAEVWNSGWTDEWPKENSPWDGEICCFNSWWLFRTQSNAFGIAVLLV